MTVAARRRHIVRACKQRGWNIKPAALQEMMDYVHSEQALENLLDGIAEGIGNGTTLTADIWEDFVAAEQERQESLALKSNSRGKKANADSSSSASAWTNQLQVVGAFETPKLVYDNTRKQFRISETQESLFGSPLDKTNMLAQRYALIHQRLLRHDFFRPNQLGHDARNRNAAVQHSLTPIESLLGKNTVSKTFLLLGILVQIEEGKYYLEDPTGQVPVSFQDARAVDGFFVTEHCILLVEGSFYDGTLYVQQVGHPLLESRKTSLAAMQQQLSHPHYVQRIGSESDEDEEPTFVILSDVHLDQPRVLQQLEALLATYENYSPSRLPLFVFMGNFSSSTTRTAPPLDELATVLSAFANLSKHAHFVLVPGPNDSAQQVLPLPPLSAKMPRVAHVHWATNPSRIYYKGREVALFCYNVLHTLQRKQICLPVVPQSSAETDLNDSMDDEEKSSHERHLHQRLVRTLLDQGHLLPVQGIPVFWNYDHALRLYPLPDALILGGDAVKDGFHEVYGGCDVVHAGSLANDSGNYAIYRWEDDAMIKAASMEDDDEDAGSGSVVFAKCGAGPTMESL